MKAKFEKLLYKQIFVSIARGYCAITSLSLPLNRAIRANSLVTMVLLYIKNQTFLK